VQIAGATSSWSWNAPAFSGHTTFAFRPYVTYDINGGSMAVYEVYVDNQGPNTPAAPNITEVGSNYVRLSWSIPTDRGSGGVADGSTETYGLTYYRAGNVGVLLHRNGPAVGSWTTATSYTDSGLSPNTWYYYQLYARDNNGESRGPWHNYSAMGPASGTYTLPVSPSVTGSRSTNTGYTTDGFSFTNNSGWGAGALDHLHYAWNTSSSGCPSASDPEWRSGTLTLYAGSYGLRYLHLMSHNPNHASGGCVSPLSIHQGILKVTLSCGCQVGWEEPHRGGDLPRLTSLDPSGDTESATRCGRDCLVPGSHLSRSIRGY
jgi:hypothetical protein